ncbi:MAG: cellulase family glycosylhydrolase [Planctomycetota bacterium]
MTDALAARLLPITLACLPACSSAPPRPWGFNYDHDEQDRLLEDYWQAEWAKVAADFGEMKELGANTVRVHLQLAKFMTSPTTTDLAALARLDDLLRLAEQLDLQLDITGLGCYRKSDVPAWYDALAEADRWEVQARFWRAVAERGAHSDAVLCYDLMNEPVAPAGRRANGEWLGPPFAGFCFVQFIALDQGDRPRPEIARAWIRRLTRAIRAVDERHAITVGLVPWSLDRPGLTSGFVPSEIAAELDFVSVHLYPEAGKLDAALDTLAGFAAQRPVLVEEIFPIACSVEEAAQFIERGHDLAWGWISFYWGRTIAESRATAELRDALMAKWLAWWQAQRTQR